ncbi:MAG TPA: hypothetical protein ENI97_06065 [Gammaproteobacteria bacterium]|nr:hypothetical protein [Gammaproteobacteria bacterium]
MQQKQVERRQSNDRRSGADRRSWECQLDFPYVDSHGTLVTEDRRKVAERRISYATYIDGDRRKGIIARQ